MAARLVAPGRPVVAVTGAGGFLMNSREIETAMRLQDILKEALAQPTVTLIDCPVDYSENFKLTEQPGSFVCPI